MMAKVHFVLDETLKKHGISRYQLSLESKTRPATISDLANGNSKSIKFETAIKIVETIKELTGEDISLVDIVDVR